jgi:hypothetical protein
VPLYHLISTSPNGYLIPKKKWKKTKAKKLIGGYLKSYTYKEACKNWWNGMSRKNKAIICSMPNFDANVFKEITGIEVTHNVD